MVKMSHVLDEAEILALERDGLRFERVDAQVAHIGPFYGVRATHAQIVLLLRHPQVRKLLPPKPRVFPPAPPLPRDVTGELTRSRLVSYRRDSQGRRLTGEGVVIAHMDTAVDVFHPHFFRADGGLYPWIDVNEDGDFQPGIDAVDLDLDQQIDDDEMLGLLGGAVLDYDGTMLSPPFSFYAGRDWLYADSNQSGQRDFGRAAGFTDATPAFGEPLFIIDDVNGDSKLQPEEKLLRLGSSKIRAVVRQYSGQIYTRGDNLIDVTTHRGSAHGSAVAGVLVGGVHGHSFVLGVAPDADLVTIDAYPAPGEPPEPYLTDVAAAAEAQTYGADILLHEYGNHFSMFADGSDEMEQFIDALSGDGMVQTTATHNFAGGNGHAAVGLAAGASHSFGLEVDVTTQLMLTLRWIGDSVADVETALTEAGGSVFVLQGDESTGDIYIQSERERSDRGTCMVATWVVGWDGASQLPLPAGTWDLSVTNIGSRSVELHVSLGDDFGYNDYASINNDTTDASTVAWPSTADTAISVGASVGNYSFLGHYRGTLEPYSGRGPRIDGMRCIDVVAPSDAYAPAPFSVGPHGAYRRFGGTSGALLQVAGAIALLLQDEPALTPAEVKERIQTSAMQDSFTGPTPNDEWGYGKLATDTLVLGHDVEDNAAPQAVVSSPSRIDVGSTVVLDASGSSDDSDDISQLTFRWDLDYDGVWDQTLFGEPLLFCAFDEVDQWFVKLEVEDSEGATAGVLHMLSVRPPRPRKDAGAEIPDGSADAAPGDRLTHQDTRAYDLSPPEDASGRAEDAGGGADLAASPGSPRSVELGTGCSCRAFPRTHMLGLVAVLLALRLARRS